jgi:hypothetical protein
MLSVGRDSLAATSVGDLAIFAGGSSASGVAFAAVDLYNVTSRSWLPPAQLKGGPRLGLSATTVGNLAIFAGGGGALFLQCSQKVAHLMQTVAGISKAVDIFDVTTGIWSTAQLSFERTFLAATSVGNIALFAGGHLRASASRTT